MSNRGGGSKEPRVSDYGGSQVTKGFIVNNYSIMGSDGQIYGPVDEEHLTEWAREGRLAPSTLVRCTETNQLSTAKSLPFLASALSESQSASPASATTPAVASPAQGKWPSPYAPQGPAGFPGASAPTGRRLNKFPIVASVLLHYLTFGTFSAIFYNFQHGNLPRLRHDDPGAGKAIGFLFIPFFNLYWVFFTYIRLCDRIAEQRMFLGLEHKNYKGLGIAVCAVMLIPYIGLLSWLILAPIFFGLLQGSINEIVQASPHAGMTYHPDTAAPAAAR